MRTTEKPTLTETRKHAGTDYEVYEHPAFAIIGASRINGTMPLFQSKIGHQGFVRLTIRRAKLEKDYLHERTYASDHLIEVNLSEAQWVALISRMNHGEGTPCTISWEQKSGSTPEIDHGADAAERLREIARASGLKLSEDDQKHYAAVREAIEKHLPKKAQQSALFELECLLTRAGRHTAFYQEQMRETAEKLTTEARIEIDAMLNGAITNLGLESAQQLGTILAADPKKAILLIADQNKKDEP